MNDAQQIAQKKAQKTKRDIIITSILLVIFAFTFTKNVVLRKSRSTLPAAAVVDESQGMADQLIYVTRLRSYDKLREDQKSIWEKEWGRDPFTPQATLATFTKAVNLRLGGIFWDEKMRKAIVNEKTLYNGDTIYGYTVVEIKPQSVVLKTGEKLIELRVFRSFVADAAS